MTRQSSHLNLPGWLAVAGVQCQNSLDPVPEYSVPDPRRGELTNLCLEGTPSLLPQALHEAAHGWAAAVLGP